MKPNMTNLVLTRTAQQIKSLNPSDALANVSPVAPLGCLPSTYSVVAPLAHTELMQSTGNASGPNVEVGELNMDHETIETDPLPAFAYAASVSVSADLNNEVGEFLIDE